MRAASAREPSLTSRRPSLALRAGMHRASRYVRIMAGLAAFWFCDDWKLFFWCYWVSYFLDCFDGAAARKFNQATRFGQMLDMVRPAAPLCRLPKQPPTHRSCRRTLCTAGYGPVCLGVFVRPVGQAVSGPSGVFMLRHACSRPVLPLLHCVQPGTAQRSRKSEHWCGCSHLRPDGRAEHASSYQMVITL